MRIGHALLIYTNSLKRFIISALDMPSTFIKLIASVTSSLRSRISVLAIKFCDTDAFSASSRWLHPFFFRAATIPATRRLYFGSKIDFAVVFICPHFDIKLPSSAKRYQALSLFCCSNTRHPFDVGGPLRRRHL